MNKIKLTGLWKEKDLNGQTVLKAKLGAFYVSIYPNSFKKKDNEPDYILYFTQKEFKNKEEKDEL